MTYVGHAVTDLDGRFVAVDRHYREVLDFTADELLSTSLHQVTFPDDLPRNRFLLRQLLLHDESFTICKRYIRRDGSIVWVENHVSKLLGRAGEERLSAASRIADEEAVARAVAASRDTSHSRDTSQRLRSTQLALRISEAAKTESRTAIERSWQLLRSPVYPYRPGRPLSPSAAQDDSDDMQS